MLLAIETKLNDDYENKLQEDLDKHLKEGLQRICLLFNPKHVAFFSLNTALYMYTRKNCTSCVDKMLAKKFVTSLCPANHKFVGLQT